MPSDILKQLRSLRDGTAEELRRDPRYLTLQALDKSIAEISAVLEGTGESSADDRKSSAPLDLGPQPPKPRADAAMSRAPSAQPAADTSHAAQVTSSTSDHAAALAAGDFAAEAIASEFQRHGEVSHRGEEGEEAGEEDPDLRRDDRAPPGPPHADDAQLLNIDANYGDDGRASGYLPMEAKPGAAVYQPSIYVKFGKLPNRVDLRPLLAPVTDQALINSAVADAVVGAYGPWVRKTTKQERDLSRLFVYFNARWRDGIENGDEGATIQFAIEGLMKFGVCSERDWPFHPDLLLHRPSLEAFKAAAPFRAHDLAQIPLRLEAWKQALAEGKPIVFGCALFGSFDDCTQRGGIVPMPSPDEITQSEHAVHAMCAVGYNDTEEVFIVRNSWGPEWGDGGYCYMPFDYLINDKLNDGDCWVIASKTPLQPPRETWSDSKQPVTNGGQGVEFAIAAFAAENYADIAADLFEEVRRPFNPTSPSSYEEAVAAVGNNDWDELRALDEFHRSLSGFDNEAGEFAPQTASDSEQDSVHDGAREEQADRAQGHSH